MAITSGQTTHASDLNALTGLTSRLDVDSANVNNSTVLVNSSLVIALAANTVYALDCFIAFDTSAAADLKWNFSLPAGSTITRSLWGSETTSTLINDSIYHDVTTAVNGTAGGVASGTIMSLRTVGTIRTSATAGNLTYQFAQNTATVVNTFLKKDSWIFCRVL